MEDKKAEVQEEIGGKTEEQAASDDSLFCPHCGKKIPEDSLYCEFCGGYVPEGEAAAVSLKQKLSVLNKKWLFGGAAVVILLLLWVVAAGGNRAGGAEKVLFYIKDNSLYGLSASGINEEPKEYSSRYLEKWSSRTGGGILSGQSKASELSSSTFPVFSNSGKFLFIPEQGEGGSFDLIREEVKNQEAKTLDGDVVGFIPVGNDNVLYQKENGALFYYDDTRRSRLTLQADYCQVSQAGDALIWTTEEDGARDIYYEDFDSGEKQRLERNAELLDASEDLNTILIKKENIVYCITGQGEKEKLVEEADAVAGVSAENGTFYFVRNVDRTPSTSYKELCYYADGESLVVDDRFGEIVWQDAETVLYKRTDDANNHMIAVNGNAAELGRAAELTDRIRRENGQLYFLSSWETGENGQPEYEVCSVLLNKEDFGRIQTIDSGVSALSLVLDGRVYYFKNVIDGIGDLYCDGELIAFDAAVASVAGVPDDGQVYCIADCSRTKGRGTLLNPGTGTETESGAGIADDVYAYSALPDGEILILTEYNRDKERGDLLLYDGESVKTVDQDIWGFYETGVSGSCR